MTIPRLILSLALMLFAAFVVVMNWGCVIVSMRNKRRGIDRHHSTVPIISFVLVALASLIYPPPLEIWMIAVPLLDIANWQLPWLPVVLIREWGKKRTAGLGDPADERGLKGSDTSSTP
jgi:hypothetical protein